MSAILPGYGRTVFFTGAGISAESGVPTYRGRGGIWGQYRWEDFACQRAFDADPHKVLDFHEQRRARVLACTPNPGHRRIAALQAAYGEVAVITQNTDGLHARAENLIRGCETFVAVGTSAVVWPAAGLIHFARASGARMIELNVDDTELSRLFDERWRGTAATLLPERFVLPDGGREAAVPPTRGREAPVQK